MHKFNCKDCKTKIPFWIYTNNDGFCGRCFGFVLEMGSPRTNRLVDKWVVAPVQFVVDNYLKRGIGLLLLGWKMARDLCDPAIDDRDLKL